MGTSDAYSGSGGRAWGDARRAVDALIGGGDRNDALTELLADAASATPWHADTPNDDAETVDPAAPDADLAAPRVHLPPMLRVPVRRGGGGLGGAGGAVSGRGGRPSGTGGGGLGTRSG